MVAAMSNLPLEPIYPNLPAVWAALREGPIYFDDVGLDLIEPLTREVLELSTRSKSTPSVNRGGWKSSEALFDQLPSTRKLRDLFSRIYLGGANPIGWAMVNRYGSEHPRHQHMIASVVGVYYVLSGDPVVPTIVETESAEFKRITAARARQNLPPHRGIKRDDCEIDPVPGRLLLMTGDTWHRVPKYIGEAPRMTISFDVRRR